LSSAPATNYRSRFAEELFNHHAAIIPVDKPLAGAIRAAR